MVTSIPMLLVILIGLKQVVASIRETSGNSPLVDETNVVTKADPNTAILATIDAVLDEDLVVHNLDQVLLARMATDISLSLGNLRLMSHHLKIGSGSNLDENDAEGLQ